MPIVTEAEAQEGQDDAEFTDDAQDDAQDNDEGVHVNVKFNPGDSLHVKGKLYIIGTAVWFLTVGVLYLLSTLLNWDCSLWDIIWPSFLLVYGVFGLIGKISLFWLACAAVGTFFLTTNIFPLPVEPDKGILWAVIIIVCGVMLLLDALRKKRRFRVINSDRVPAHEYKVNDGYLCCSNSFGEQDELVTAELLEKGKISNSFGEYTVDLSGVAAVAENCIIDASCSFGELKVLVPKRFSISSTSSTAFADFSVKGEPDEHPDGYIQLKASVNFGEIVLKYI